MGPMIIETSRGCHLLIGKALPPLPLKTGEFLGPQVRARGRVPVRFFLYLVSISFQTYYYCLTYCHGAGAMNPDLDAVLFSDGGAGAQKSKRPRIPRRSDRPSKVPRRHETTPTAQTNASIAKEPTVQVDASGSTAHISLLPTETQLAVVRPRRNLLPPRFNCQRPELILRSSCLMAPLGPKGLCSARRSFLEWVRAFLASAPTIGTSCTRPRTAILFMIRVSNSLPR